MALDVSYSLKVVDFQFTNADKGDSFVDSRYFYANVFRFISTFLL